jgi:uncharacterized protein YbjT (DUF2867 family)
MATILLTGANGKVSSATIRALQSSGGHRLIGLVRDASKGKDLEALGVELRVGDLSELRTVENAFEGVDTALVLTPPGPLAPIQSSNALWGARRGGVKHVVRMSAVGAAHDAPTLNSRLHALSDAELERSGITYTILKPHFFTQNLMMSAPSVAKDGVLYLPLGDAKVPMIDVRDIADVTAAVLSNPRAHAGKTYTLTGAAALGMSDVAAALAEATGKNVKYVAVPVSAMVETLTKMGADDFAQVATRDYFIAYSQGWHSNTTPFVEQITGNAPRTIAVFARDFAAALAKG